MPKIASACTSYIESHVEIYFSGDACCANCPLLETYSRNMCRRTGEYIADTRGRGYWCPLKFDKEDENGISDAES